MDINAARWTQKTSPWWRYKSWVSEKERTSGGFPWGVVQLCQWTDARGQSKGGWSRPPSKRWVSLCHATDEVSPEQRQNAWQKIPWEASQTFARPACPTVTARVIYRILGLIEGKISTGKVLFESHVFSASAFNRNFYGLVLRELIGLTCSS